MPDPGAVGELLSAFEDCLEREDVVAAHGCLHALCTQIAPDDVELSYARARLTWLEHGAQAARRQLVAIVGREPRHADAHYDLGCIAEEQGDTAEMVRRFLRVRALDAAADKASGIGAPTHFDYVEQVARELLEGLPEMFVQRLSRVPVMIERRPGRSLVAGGFDPRSFGLFEGPTDAMRDVVELTRIVLYACNLLAAFPHEPELSAQIEVTLLHEIGHFFGLDEDQLVELGLG